MKKRILSAVLALVMCLSLLPAQALAATEPAAEPAIPVYPAIHVGVDGITGWDAETNTYDYIYYGNWQNHGQNAPHPLKWRVLDDETNMGTDNGLFLLSERLLTSSRMGIYFEQTGDVTGEKFETGFAGLKNLFDSIKDLSPEGALNIYKTYGYNTMHCFSDVYNWLTDFAGVTTGAYAGRDGKPYADVDPAFSSEELAAIPAMQWACGAGLMQGDGVNLTPKADATRAQAAALFQRFCEKIIK